MHVNVQLRFNPELATEPPYYRLKESYRDIRGNVHPPGPTPAVVTKNAAPLTHTADNERQQ